MNDIPDDGRTFKKAMREIDAEMRAADVPIPARQLDGARRFARRYMPGAVILGPGQPEIIRKVMDWISTRYGDRLATEPSDGDFVTEIGGDFFRVVPPKFWGQVKFFTDQSLSDYDRGGMDRPCVYNIMESVEGLTSDLSASLSANEVRCIHSDFLSGLRATSFLAKNNDIELIARARVDLRTSVSHLLAHPIQSGDAKWSSLLAAEKLLKGAIVAHGGKFGKVHELAKLARELAQLGVGGTASALTSKIQCTPGIRYGEEECTARDAFEAHKAFIALTLQVYLTSRNLEKKFSWVEVPINWNPPSVGGT